MLKTANTEPEIKTKEDIDRLFSDEAMEEERREMNDDFNISYTDKGNYTAIARYIFNGPVLERIDIMENGKIKKPKEPEPEIIQAEQLTFF